MEVTEDEMVRWQHQLNGCESYQTPGDSEGQGSLACYSSWGRRESDTTEQWNNSSLKSACQHQSGGPISYNMALKIQLAKEIHLCPKSHPFTMLYYSIQGLAIEIQREKYI